MGGMLEMNYYARKCTIASGSIICQPPYQRGILLIRVHFSQTITSSAATCGLQDSLATLTVNTCPVCQ
jgi:hypothetical protein